VTKWTNQARKNTVTQRRSRCPKRHSTNN